jgi:hypothetical protein
VRGSVVRWAPRLAALLVLAALALASVAGVTQARYATSDSAGYSARVAAWDVRVTAASGSGSLELGTSGDSTASYAFTVANGGEVAASYTVVVSLPPDLPAGTVVALQYAADGSAWTEAATVTVPAKGGAASLTGKGELPVGGTAAWRVSFTRGSGAVGVDSASVEVSVEASQID